MDTAGSKCPENQNSTECLLRALLNVLAEQKQASDRSIDWDPITFGLTLLIGLVASLIALATVFQAVLAGGKGGRRANSRAIGKWSKHTTRKWILAEMSWSYTAYTPALNMWTLKKTLDSARLEIEERRRTKKREPDLGMPRKLLLWGKDKLSVFRRDSVSVAPYPATWLGLLEYTGLVGYNLPLAPITADYLPDDFITVPASAEVGVIVVITAVAGVLWLDDDLCVYPTIVGYNFQFDFRQLPVLGIIGAFSEYRRFENGSFDRTPSSEKIAQAMKHSRGMIEPLFGYSNEDSAFIIRKTPRNLNMHLLRAYILPKYKGRDCFVQDYDFLDQNQVLIASFILAKSPRFAPSLFPSPEWKGHNPFTAIALNGKFWSKVRPRDFEESNWKYEPNMELLSRESVQEHFKWLEISPDAADETVDGIYKQHQRPSPSGVKHQTILLCLGLLKDPRELQVKISQLPFERRETLRQAVHVHLRLTDEWLASTQDEELVSLRTQHLLFTSIILSKAESMTQGGLFEVTGATKLNPKQTEQQQQQPQPPLTVQDVHFKMLGALRGLMKDFDISQRSFEAVLKIAQRDWEEGFENLRRLQDHLRHEVFTGSRAQAGQQVTLEDKTIQDDFEKKLQESQSQMRSLIGPRCDLRSRFFNTHQVLNRLATVVGCHSDSEDRDRQTEKPDMIDDVLIFRSLLIGVLFLTAVDNSKVLESGVWDRVVPII
ncbi:hypothetical protein CPAR01_15176 [Colletotrichum paranaense]|uniref:Uncharacterized protein n=1 Tax=Colletotrichum paranaense TaxID=1914294 RepID=A0ABQ9S0J1_9PEZI|nr:uncharacterized protein CPAR01_15176 [Colletotrichum paranaense]KAK1520125.1 hypothetical protein CPAR01_15176 [Colletotrichum paranaense]